MKVTELFTLEELDTEIREGFVKVQVHPHLPLSILNYTDKATYERRWNNVTRHCRGLIIHMDTKEVIARGPAKFFNYGEPSAKTYPLDTQVRLTRKEDGSLGIGWQWADEDEYEAHYGIATRGSFTSEQAVHASELVEQQSGHNGKHELLYDALCQYTDNNISYIGEIVYPENRIVLDYAGRDEVITLGTVDNRTGLINWRSNNTLVDGLPAFMTLAEAIALPIPDDEEGYVLDIMDEYLNVVDHLKLKGARYKELHAAIFGLSEKTVWEAFSAGKFKGFVEGLPDEVQPWAQNVRQRIIKERWDLVSAATDAKNDVDGMERKDQAQYIMKHHKDIAPAVFALLDDNYGKCNDWLTKQTKPGHVPFTATKESVSL